MSGHEDYKAKVDAALRELQFEIEKDLYRSMTGETIEIPVLPWRTCLYRRLMRPVWAVQRWLVHRLGGVMEDEIDYDY